MSSSTRTTIMFLAGVMLLAACTGQRFVRGEMPLIGIDSLERSGNTLTVILAVRNINDQTFEISALSFDLLVDDIQLARGDSQMPVTIAARSRERIRIETTGIPAGLEKLEALAGGERRNLPWSMDISLSNERGRSRDAEISGWLHAVPGQPGRFR